MQILVIYFMFFPSYSIRGPYATLADSYNSNMQNNAELPIDLTNCHTLLREQIDVITKLTAENSQQAHQLEELLAEQEKLRKLIARLAEGNRSERRLLSDDTQGRLPFEEEAEWQAAKAEAEAEAEEIEDKITGKRGTKKTKPRNESLPSHLRRQERVAPVSEEMTHCPTHGERTMIGYDTTETLMRKPPELYVLVTKYPKFARSAGAVHETTCAGRHRCGAR